MSSERTLGGDLAKLLNNLTDLIEKETDQDNIAQLRRQQKAIHKQLKTLVDENVARSNQDYEDALESLKEANAQITKAKKDLAEVADTIEKIAKVISFLSKIASLVS